MQTDPKQDEQTRAAHWSMMLSQAGKHVDPNPPSPKARIQNWKRPEDHAFNHFKFN